MVKKEEAKKASKSKTSPATKAVPVKKQTKSARTAAKPTLKSDKIKSYWHENWQAILIAVVLVGILGFIGINQLIIYNQKQEFKAAEESLDAIYADIVSKVGQPTSSEKYKYCSYSSAKYSKGRLSCRVGNLFKITNKDMGSSKALSSSIEELLKKDNRLKYIKSYSEDGRDITDRINVTNDLNINNTSLACHASHMYNIGQPYDNNTYVFTISCGGGAREEYFTLES